MQQYRRHLPHQVPDGWPIFLTWNLKGALPRHVALRLRAQREELQRQPPRIGESPAERRTREGKLLFATADNFLDGAKTGPLHLADSACAALVESAVVFGAGDRYELLAWCVMPNHVHVVLTPIWALRQITQGVKGFTAREINRLQHQAGRIFWQDESYDHWIRDPDELTRIVAYVETNPVKASLCEGAGDFRWSSARFRDGWALGESFQKRQYQTAPMSG